MSKKKRRGGYLATVEGVKKLKEAKRIKKYTYKKISDEARETEDKVKRLFNPQWGNGQYKVGEEAIEAICSVLDLKPEEIVSDWYALEIASEQTNSVTLAQEKTHDPSYYEALKRIRRAINNESKDLSLSWLKLTEIPSEIGQLSKLKHLSLSNNSLSSLPPEIGQLSNLTHLYLENNYLSSLPPEIGQLSNLTHLYLENNYLSSLPPEIGQLAKLKELIISNNNISNLPLEIGRIKQLSKFVVIDNNLSILPPEIGQLSNLKCLYIRNNNLNNLPSAIGQLNNLEELDIRNNNLNNLPSAIGQLSNLKHLNISYNQLSSLPSEIGQLSNLENLYLNGNNLDNIPLEIDQTTNLRELNLHRNPLSISIPWEILEKYHEPYTIIDYFLSLQKNKQKPIHEAKMLLVGQPNVGKTCLKERLIRNQYDWTRNKTDGIDIEFWNIEVESKQLQVNIWDFGGQEIMHSTHQFFLTKRSLYLLVVDTTQSEEENRIEYWLKIIQSFGKDSPVIIVGNKADQHPLDIDKNGLKQKYPQIRGFYEISCETGTGISELAEIVKQEINQLEHIDDLLPLPWFNIKQKLEEIKKDYIPYEEYEYLCETEGIEKEDNQRILIRLLNDLGIVLNFQDDPRLEDTHVLNPEWVTNGVYKILNDRGLIVENRGILTIPTLKRILHQLNKKRYPAHKHLFIIGMMRKFELCFDIETDKQFLIPDILPKEELYTGEWDNTLAFEYHYPVLPGSIISRFIVRMNHYIHQKTYWRSGVVLANEDNLALVKADREDKIIKIRVKGKTNTKRNLLTAIRSQFDYIHKTIPGIVPIERVPLIEHPEIILDYQELLGLEAMGEKTVVIGKLKQRIPLRQLLDGIESPAERIKHDPERRNRKHREFN